MITKVESIPEFAAIGRPRIYDVSAVQEFLESGFEIGRYELPTGLTAKEEKAYRAAFVREGLRNGVKVCKRGSSLYLERA